MSRPSLPGAFVRGSGIRERKRAVDRDADRACDERASQFRELCAVRTGGYWCSR